MPPPLEKEESPAFKAFAIMTWPKVEEEARSLRVASRTGNLAFEKEERPPAPPRACRFERIEPKT